MKSFKFLLKCLMLVGIVSVFASCGNDDDTATPDPQTIVDIAAADAQFSILVGALQRTGLDATLNGAGPFTVFAPNNAAFDGVDVDALSDDDLKNILLYHVFIGQSLKSTALAEDNYIGMASTAGVNGLNLTAYVKKSGSDVTVNGNSNVISADIEGTNGIIHVIDKVMLLPTIVDHAAANDDFSTLVGALGSASGDLVPTLSGTDAYTVFAPTNAAFADVNTSGLSADELRDVLLYHVVGGGVQSTDLAEGDNYVDMANAAGPGGSNLTAYISRAGDAVTINGDITVALANIVGTNGIIHVVDKVMLPMNIVGHAAANPLFSELVGALGAASGDLVNVLSGTDTYTVFAPVNDAFKAIESVTATLTADQLRDILLYHVVGSANVRSTDLSNNQVVTTANGATFTVNTEGGVTITDAQGNVADVVLTDVQTTNGVIHVLNKVILP